MTAWDDVVLGRLLVRYADLNPDGVGLVMPSIAGPACPQEFSIVGGNAAYPCAVAGGTRSTPDVAIRGLRQSYGLTPVSRFSDSAEACVAHAGRWRVVLGPNGEGDGVELAPGDVVSIPAHTYRRMERLDDAPGFLFIVQGTGADAMPESVAAMPAANREAGMRIPGAGRWIDLSGGLPVLREFPSDDSLTSAAHATGVGALSGCAIAASALVANPQSHLASDGIEEAAVIAPSATRDGFGPGPIKGWWPHGFSMRCLTLSSGAYVPMHSRGECEILFLQEGTLEVGCANGAVTMGAGDTLTVPTGLSHAFRNATSQRTRVFVVRASEDPEIPLFQSTPRHG